MTPIVSVIMPAYNAEAYVAKAIESILLQSLSDWELIIIDDGSTDKTASILDGYANKDARIKVIHQINHGVGFSRQLGINKAMGKFCIHVDADDWVEPDYLRLLVSKAEAEDADMVWCDAYVNESAVWSMKCKEDSAWMIREILNRRLWGTLWNRLFKTSICQQKDIAFPACTYWEDVAFVIQCLTKCNKICHISVPLYHYRQVETSLLHVAAQKDISKDYRIVADCLDAFMSKNNLIEKFGFELRGLKLYAIRDFIDDVRFKDYDKFVQTYPDAIEHIWEYKDYPIRLKVCSWLIQHHLRLFCPFVCKLDALLRRFGITKQI